jgi:phosphoglycolate phosphatase
VTPVAGGPSSRKPGRAVLLDLDGTLLDTAPELAEAVNRMLADFALEQLPVAQVRQYIGRGVGSLVRQVLVAASDGAPAPEAAQARFEVHYAAVNGTMAQAYDGVVQGLEALLAGGWRLGCVTNKARRFAEPLLARTGLAPYFGSVVCGDTLPTMKPSPEPLLHACDALAAAPVHSFMVGDSMDDVRAAVAAGLRVYVVPYGYSGKDSAEILRQERVLSRLDQLPERLAAERVPA